MPIDLSNSDGRCPVSKALQNFNSDGEHYQDHYTWNRSVESDSFHVNYRGD